MTVRAPDFAERRAVIAKVSWFRDKGRLGFRGELGGVQRLIVGDDESAATKTKLVDLAVEMDAGRA